MNKIFLTLLLLLLILYSCGPKKVKYEDATKWYKDCVPHPMYHPGDYYAYSEICTVECARIDNSDTNAASSTKEDNPGSPSYMYSREADKMREMWIKKYSCITGCIERINTLATHVEGGYYTDGSYFAMCMNPFENIHPTKDKYEKSKWQTDRDECTQITYENVEQTFWSRERGQFFYGKWLNRAMKHYRECLDKKGYSTIIE